MGLLLVFTVTLVQLATLIGLGALICRFAKLEASWVVSGWCGFAAFLILAQLAHLFLPLGSWFAPVMFGLSAFGWRTAWTARPPIAGSLLTLSVTVLCCFCALSPVVARDNGLYFIQSTLWARDFAAVPGLANLHPCLGANHAYFSWVASWAVGPLHEQPWLVANGALLTLACAPGLFAVTKWQRPTVQDAAAIVLLGPLFDVVLSGQVSSPVADVALACVQAALTLWLLDACTREISRTEAMLAAFVCVAFATLKVAGAQQALICWCFMLFTLRGQRRAFVATFAGSVVLLLPWLINGLISSGYPLFPSPMFGLPVSWRVPSEVARAYLNVSSAQHHAFLMYDRSGVLPGDWPLHWLSRSWLLNRDFLIPSIAWLAGIVGAVVRRDRAWLRFSLMMSAALVLWFIASPELRFAQLTLWGAAAGSLALLVPIASQAGRVTLAAASALIIAWSFVEYPLPKFTIELPQKPAWESRRYTLPSGDSLLIGAGNFDCYELPCVLCPYESLQFREPGNLSAGFSRDPSDSAFFECGGAR